MAFEKAPWCRVLADASRRDLVKFVAECLPEGCFRNVLIKPNWVRHQVDPRFPIRALVSSPRLIEAAIEACLIRYPGLETITVADAPVQDCDFDLLCRQSGVDQLIEKYSRRSIREKIRFADLRRERFKNVNGFLTPIGEAEGDPRGYREVILGQESFLDEICAASNSFRISDYQPQHTAQYHRPGWHRYLIAASALEADLVINLAKAKTHRLAGITGALKNIVGITGDKSGLAHFRIGSPATGGDEFCPSTPALVKLQTRCRERWQKKSPLAFEVGRRFWQLLRRLWQIETEFTPDNQNRNFYQAGGAWPGNDTVWRMIYDLNNIIRYAPREGGRLAAVPQRVCFCLVDALVAGEGNGPLQPLPVEADLVMASPDPVAVDLLLAAWMGFDWRRIRQLARYRGLHDPSREEFGPEQIRVDWNGLKFTGIDQLPERRRFRPAPGWEEIWQEKEVAACVNCGNLATSNSRL